MPIRAKRLPVSFLALATTLALSTPTSGNYYAGNSWADACYQRQYGLLAGYLAGIVDASEVSMAPRPFCIPEGVTLEQLSDVFCAEVREHPEMRHYLGSALAFIAFRTSFPCKG